MGEIRESESEVREIGKGKEVSVMDTPDRSKTHISAPISKFEESPVFNFLNNLSPIKPAKSVSVTQSMNVLSFASLPSVFTSPHVSSLKESRFLRRHQGLDPAKPEFSSDYGNKFMADGKTMGVVGNDNEQQKIIDPDNSVAEVSVERPLECSNPTGGLVESLNCNCSTPVCQPNVLASSEFMSFSEFAANSGEVPFAQVAPGNGLFGSEACTEQVCPETGNAGATGCDWEAISDVTDLLTFDSPMGTDSSKRSFSPVTGFYNDNTSDLQNMQPMRSLESGYQNETDNPSTQPGEGSYSSEIAEMDDMLADSSLALNYLDGNFEQKMNIEPVSHLYRGVRRRCLVFEMAGGRMKHLEENSNSVSPILKPSEGEAKANDKQLVSMRINNDSKCILPGIGLHLNALAASSKECNGVKQDASVSGRLIIAPGPSTNFHSFKVAEEQLNQSLVRTSTQNDVDPGDNGVMLLEDAGHSSMHIENEELNQNSPKKKRRRVEHALESESSCKRCNCKKSKCLKLYCECFAAGVYCVEPCSCQECFNKPIHEETLLATRKQIESRNPLAFAPKVIRAANSQAEAGEESSKTPASARHKRGCNCKKSGCLKKYCECYQGGVGCSINCRCERCKNAFGRKDGSAFVGPETELEEDEIDELEKSAKRRSAHKTAIRIGGEHNADSVPPATPFQFKRPLDQHSMSSKSKPPRSTTSSIGTSSLYPNKGLLGRSNFLPPPKFDKHFETVSEEELPEILQGSGSSPAGIKSSSPNSKRVSPPHSDFGMSPNRRSSRKLILQSIPSFPSLTPNKH